MELMIIPKGSGKFDVVDGKGRKIYSVTKKRKLMGNPITTLHDASGYALYTMVRTASGKKPSFQIIFNDALFMTVQCKSLYVDPSILYEGDPGKFELKGKSAADMELKTNNQVIGGVVTEQQSNGNPKYKLTIDDQYFDDYIPLFAVAVDASPSVVAVWRSAFCCRRLRLRALAFRCGG